MMLPKAYDPKATEDRIYKMWEESGAFKADASSDKEPFTVSMPPPNATGQLHLGHSVMLALEDIFIRFARAQGKEALWLPGTDHAAIATESVVIKKIQAEEGIPDPRAKLGRKELIKRIAHFVDESQDTIRSQVRKMGSSCDWSRERYTMDPSLNRCVNEVFIKMYKDGLIYRGHRIVNWDPKMQTTVADDEVEYIERKDPYYTFQYGPFQISTSRPETKFGDKYVVVHPDDPRYKQFANGDQFECEWINGKITATVIKDAEIIDMEMGTGCMTVTPWHDKADFDLAERHDLDKEQVIDYEGKLLSIAGEEFAGMHIEDARPKVVKKLEDKGLLVGVDENYKHNVALNYRGKGMIEPQIMEQWFIDVNKKVVPWIADACEELKGKKRKKSKKGKKGVQVLMSLKEVMQYVIRNGDIKIIPERFEKVYFHWIDNLRDWCISRQIWWGHQIPVWYKEGRDSAEMHVGVQEPEGDGWKQDPDTLDTWFSSGLWTWSTLIDPALADDHSLSLQDLLDKSPDFRKFHPTSVIETGYDILFFWVARMILMTTYATGQIPFETVYLHGLIRTRDGAKMSKSDPETMIDPLDIISKYGADALRLSMIVGQSPGNDSRLFEEKIAGYRNFVNKLWNASRFVLMQCEEAGVDPHQVSGSGSGSELSLADKAVLEELDRYICHVTKGLHEYQLSEVGEKLYGFVWDFFCDWYLELSKGEANADVLVHVLRHILILLHPYCPYVTEELWSSVKPQDAGMLISHSWPLVKDESEINCENAGNLHTVIKIIKYIRSIRAEQGIDPGKEIDVIIHTDDYLDLLKSQSNHIKRLARVKDLTINSEEQKHENAASAILSFAQIFVPLEGIIDFEKEKAKLAKEKAKLQSFAKSIESKLGNKKFVSNAPEEVISTEREKLENAKEKLEKVEERLKVLE